MFENKKKFVYYIYGIFKWNNLYVNIGIFLEWINGWFMLKCVREIWMRVVFIFLIVNKNRF